MLQRTTSSNAPLKIKRVYDLPGEDDGACILVDRLWPRGLPKDKTAIGLWLKDIAPSDGLRKRFHGDPEDWEQSRAAYTDELEEPVARSAVQTLRERLRPGTGDAAARGSRRTLQQRGGS